MGRSAAGGGVVCNPRADRPLPGVASDVEQAVAVGRERPDRRRPEEAVVEQVLPGELTLPRVRLPAVMDQLVVTPGESGTLESAPGRELPFHLGRQGLAGPARVRLGV